MMKDDGLGCVVEIVDALFRDIAEIVVVGDDVSPDEALDGVWFLDEHGFLRLVSDPDRDRLGVEPCGGNRSERRAMAAQNRRLVLYRNARRESAPEFTPT
jgi:hypothetical protein